MNADPHRILKKLLLPVLLAALLGVPQGGGAQGVGAGFAGLGSSADGFEVPAPGRRLQFPADHGAHYGYRVEWWYLTA
ncbi:MAG: lipocalin-like domain-containing protein, partial [Brevirhabdus sp.]